MQLYIHQRKTMGMGTKRKTPETTESLSEPISKNAKLDNNKNKMDTNKIKQCSAILKKLMNHPFGWVFNQPVDPVKLNILDYFSIITNPMDLGTIRQNLVRKVYFTPGQFASDVRLTFSNAMLYNPPGNDVHTMAEQLNHMFNSGWKSMEEKWDSINNTDKGYSKGARAESETNPKKVNRVAMDSPLDAKHSEVVAKHSQGSARASCKGNGANGVRCSEANDNNNNNNHNNNSNNNNNNNKDNNNNNNNNNNNKVNDNSLCRSCNGQSQTQKNGSRQSSLNDFDSERFNNSRDDCPRFSISCKKEKPTVIKISRVKIAGPKSEALVERNNNSHSFPSTSPTIAFARVEEENLPCAEPLSPTRALRAAMLKSRFADTIVKAQQRALLDQGKKVDPAKLQLEREKLEKRQKEEKERIEAQVKAAEAAARMKAEAELKMKREKEREAARLALQKMEKTVEIDNSELLKELESLNYSLTWHLDPPDQLLVNFTNGIDTTAMNPLEKLGLFMKNEEFDDDDLEGWLSPASNEDIEDGEIG